MVQKGNLAVFEGKRKGSKSPKPKKPDQPKLVCMHFTSTSTCMNFLSQFYFLTPMDYIVHGLKRNFGHFEGKQKRGEISKTKEDMPIKFGFQREIEREKIKHNYCACTSLQKLLAHINF